MKMILEAARNGMFSIDIGEKYSPLALMDKALRKELEEELRQDGYIVSNEIIKNTYATVEIECPVMRVSWASTPTQSGQVGHTDLPDGSYLIDNGDNGIRIYPEEKLNR